MFNYSTLSPNRRQFIDFALDVFPDLTDSITSKQIDQVVSAKGITYPQWMITEANRISRGVYHFPLSTEEAKPVVQETDDEISLRIQETYEAMEDMVRAVSANAVNSLIITGAPGLGKSHTVNKILNEVNSGTDYNYVFHKGYLRASHLFRLLWENRHPGMVIVIDDSDSIFSDENALNILKSALELKSSRKIGWGSEKVFEDSDNEQIPRYFDYEGSVVFLTNKDIRGEISSNNKNAPHLSALESRSLLLDLKIKTKREYMIKIKQTVAGGMLKNKGFNQQEENSILQFINDNKDNLSELSLRIVEKVAALYRSNPSNWQKLVRAVCFK